MYGPMTDLVFSASSYMILSLLLHLFSCSLMWRYEYAVFYKLTLPTLFHFYVLTVTLQRGIPCYDIKIATHCTTMLYTHLVKNPICQYTVSL